MSIKAHCMGMEFPKRDTDNGSVSWVVASDVADAIRVQEMAEDLVSVAGDKVLARLAEKLDREIAMDHLPFPVGQGFYRWECICGNVSQMIEVPNWKRGYPLMDTCPQCGALPSAADMDAVAEEQRVKEKTNAQVPNR